MHNISSYPSKSTHLSLRHLELLPFGGSLLVALDLPNTSDLLANAILQLLVQRRAVAEMEEDLQVNEEWGEYNGYETSQSGSRRM